VTTFRIDDADRQRSARHLPRQQIPEQGVAAGSVVVREREVERAIAVKISHCTLWLAS